MWGLSRESMFPVAQDPENTADRIAGMKLLRDQWSSTSIFSALDL